MITLKTDFYTQENKKNAYRNELKEFNSLSEFITTYLNEYYTEVEELENFNAFDENIYYCYSGIIFKVFSEEIEEYFTDNHGANFGVDLFGDDWHYLPSKQFINIHKLVNYYINLLAFNYMLELEKKAA